MGPNLNSLKDMIATHLQYQDLSFRPSNHTTPLPNNNHETPNLVIQAPHLLIFYFFTFLITSVKQTLKKDLTAPTPTYIILSFCSIYIKTTSTLNSITLCNKSYIYTPTSTYTPN